MPDGPYPIVLGASPYQKVLRYLPPNPVFAFTEYGPMQLYLDQGRPADVRVTSDRGIAEKYGNVIVGPPR